MFRYTSKAMLVVGVSCVLLAAAPAYAAKAAKNSSDWKIMGAGAEVKAGTMYTLRNITDNNSLKYGERTWGINLVWDKSTTLNNIKFVRKDGSTGVLKYGETVAIHVKGGGYLQHEHRTVGINLGWSSKAKYEFVIVGGMMGTPVKTGAAIGLVNTSAKDFIIYAERPAGVNLRWFKDRDLAGGFWDRVRAEAYSQLKDHGMDFLRDLIK